MKLYYYILSVLAPLLATFLGLGLEQMLHRANVSLVYLLGVILVSLRTGPGPALVCAIVSFILYNYFFTEPQYTLMISQQEELWTILLFLTVAGVAGQQAVRLRQQLSAMEELNRVQEVQFQLSQKLSRTNEPREIFDALIAAVADLTGKQSGIRESSHPGGFPLSNGEEVVGVLSCSELSEDQRDQLADSLIPQTELALSRARLALDVQRERMDKEREMLRSALLSSVSHDLRTPLASISGAATTLLDLRDSLSPEAERELLEAIYEEAIRLDNYTRNLLDITQIEYGVLEVNRDWVDLDEILRMATHRISPFLRGRKLVCNGTMPVLHVQSSLISQALFNLLDNAVKYSPENSSIAIDVHESEGVVCIDVHNDGESIPESEQDKIFDSFHRVSQRDYQRAGTGLGLPISRGLARAHGGDVVLLESGCTGTTVRLILPLSPLPDEEVS